MMDNLNPLTISNLLTMLNAVNPFVGEIKSALDRNDGRQNLQIVLKEGLGRDRRRYNCPSSSEIAAVIPGSGVDVSHRDIILQTNGGMLKRINELHGSYDPLQYVLLFPHGDYGFQLGMERTNGKRLSSTDYYRYRLMEREGESNYIQKSGRLYQQYIVDQYAKIEINNLNYYRNNQTQLRAELYQGIVDAGNSELRNIGRRIVLPSSFTGGPRQMKQLLLEILVSLIFL